MPSEESVCISAARDDSAYLSAEAKMAETKSQNTLPAPPMEIPTATPTILPMPRVPARARVKEERASRLSREAKSVLQVRKG